MFRRRPKMTLDTLILNYRDYYGSYHNHKENMAYVATTLHLAATTWVILERSNLWEKVEPVSLLVLLIAGCTTGFLFVYWQLDKRDFAANVVEACTTLATRSLKPGSKPPELTPTKYKGLCFPQVLVKELERIKKNLEWYEFYKGSRFSKRITLFIMFVWTSVALASIGLNWVVAIIVLIWIIVAFVHFSGLH